MVKSKTYNLNVYKEIPNNNLLKVFKAGPERLRRMIYGLDELDLRNYVIPSKWNILEIVIHVAQSELVGACRIRQTITGSDRLFPFYDQDIWVNSLIRERNSTVRDMFEHLQLFDDLRETTSKIFEKASLNDWTRTGIHPENGIMTLRQLLELYADHSERHIEQIDERRKLLGKAIAIEQILPVRLY